MEQRDADLLLGIFVKNEQKRVLNSVLNIDGQVYHKRHLVPLGEFIPLRFLIEFFNRFVKIPMSDIASGDEDQPLLTAAGVPLGLSICFEDAFARDVIKDLPAAKLLVNVSNDAWFEDSHEPHQHHAIARMRALEAGRFMIRSTNTGITSFIGPHGEVIKQLPQFETGVLNGQVLPLVGATPFVRWGDGLIVLLSSLLLAFFAGWKVKYRPTAGE
jgi:apolipoprotein N-acyltransferase